MQLFCVGGTGDDWRLHTAYDLQAGRLCQASITDRHGGEKLSHFHLCRGDLVVADRGYGFRCSVALASQQEASVVLRFVLKNFPLHAEAKFRGSLPFYLRFPARTIMLQAQHYSRLREVAKNSLLHLVAVGREMILLAGKVLTKDGGIFREDDIFFLSLQDILDGLAGEKDHLAEKILESKIRAARFDKIEPADVFIGSKPFYLELDLPDRVVLKGMAASPGRVTAPARVLHSPSEGSRLVPGDILVCPTIDSLWIAAFFLASGIIAEIGGVLSHGAIIARELGIPMVINVSGAMSNITDGQILTVDGNLGKVFT